jgi:hypothetical protein
MKSRAVVVWSLALTACGSSLYANLKGTSPSDPDKMFNCVRNELAAKGFEQRQVDIKDRWIVTQQVDSGGRVSSGLYRRTLNRIEATVHPDQPTSSKVEMKIQTFNEFMTARGFNQEEQSASPESQATAKAVLDKCQSLPTDAVPPAS